MNFVSRFLKGNWLGKAKIYAFNPLKLKNLLQKLGSLMSRQGLLKVKDHLILMRDYLSDIATGKYKEYDGKKLIIIVAAIIYVVTPIDFLPDFIPPGWIDDVSIVAWAIKEASEEMERYKKYKETKKS